MALVSCNLLCMEFGERSFPRGDGRSPRRSGNMVSDVEGGRYDIFQVSGTEERDGRLFWPSLKSATSKAAITGIHILWNAAKRIADRRDFDIQLDQQKEHIYKAQSTWPTSFSSKCKSSSKGRL